MVPDPANVSLPRSGDVSIHASIYPAPDFDIVFGDEPPQLLRSAGQYAPRVYWLIIGDADRGTLRTRIGDDMRPHDVPWTRGLGSAMDIIRNMERRRRTWRPSTIDALERFRATMASWTRTESGACLVVDRIEPAPR